MSLNELEAKGRLRRHETSAQEVADLMRMAEAGLADARVEAVTLDRRFCAAYDAARALADPVLACSGYRPAGQGSARDGIRGSADGDGGEPRGIGDLLQHLSGQAQRGRV